MTLTCKVHCQDHLAQPDPKHWIQPAHTKTITPRESSESKQNQLHNNKINEITEFDKNTLSPLFFCLE